MIGDSCVRFMSRDRPMPSQEAPLGVKKVALARAVVESARQIER